jgi:hypothetical protein
MVMSWPYMNALIDWNNMQANKKQQHEALLMIEHMWLTGYSTTQKRELIHTNDITLTPAIASPPLALQAAVWFLWSAQGQVAHI